MTHEFWFIVGSQHLYGPEVLKEVEKHSITMEEGFNASKILPFKLVFKQVVTDPSQITNIMKKANSDDTCAGVVTWMHTFSPSKMWISGLNLLDKPYLHLNTQFNRNIPFESIDMNFMNTNQSAHGDREHGFITARLRMRRKIISGFWQDDTFIQKIADWMRSAIGALAAKETNIMRLGDNMRYVAVTEGDKVEAEKIFGWAVNAYSVGDFAKMVNGVKESQIKDKMDEYLDKYLLDTDNIASVKYQAALEIALEDLLKSGNFNGYTNTFENLFGLLQLPGLATQNLMSKGYGFGPEGDWKQAALQVMMGKMSKGLTKGYSFIEDYTYHLEEGNEAVLGAHMLEISPLIAQDKPKISVHELGIGGKNPPARLVFEGKEGDALLVTIVDMGGRFRMISHDIKVVKPFEPMPKLPVARVMWRPMPDMNTGNEAWIRCGGTHHSILTYDLKAQHMADLAEILGIEFIHISKDTKIEDLKLKLALGDIVYK